jgi:hypothetical protein
MRYFRISDSFKIVDRWYLGTPRTPEGDEIDPRLLTGGSVYRGRGPLLVPVKEGKTPLDFTLGAFDMPVVAARVAEVIEKYAPGSVQRIPVVIGSGIIGHEALNVLKKLKGMDEKRSLISYWTAEDGQPEKVGTYCGVARIALDIKAVKGVQIFRLDGWEVPIIVDEHVKDALTKLCVTGIEFEAVQA